MLIETSALNNLWAKSIPFQSVLTHGIISGTVCHYLTLHFLSPGIKTKLSKIFNLPEMEIANFLAYLTSLHDIGKIEFHFQCLCPETNEYLHSLGLHDTFIGHNFYRHEKTGETVLRKIWKEFNQDYDASDVFSSIVGAHHQKGSGQGSKTQHPFFKEAWETYEKEMRSHFLSNPLSLPPLPDKDEGVMEAVILGLLILSDWISSGEAFANAEQWIHNKNAQEQIAGKVEEFLLKSGLAQDEIAWGNHFTDVWPWIPQNMMRPIQQTVQNLIDSGEQHSLVLIEAPMGEGKTEAGMFAAVQMAKAWNKTGFYVALPTAATSNQMVHRLRSWFKAVNIHEQVRLLHGMAWLTDDSTLGQCIGMEDASELAKWLAPLRRGLLGQFSVGTIDQAMLSVTRARYSVLRLLGLSNKVLVIDEIHSYDVYMEMFIELLLKWCKALDVPVVMLSATLAPNLKKKMLAPYTSQPLSGNYPLVTAITADGHVVEHKVPKTVKKMTVKVETLSILKNPHKIAIKATDVIADGGCLCVLMNTVKQAQAVYVELQKTFDGELLLFHAQFPAERRNEIENECIRKFGKDKSQRPRRAILVATQVVEQSLDVDFDVMMTAIAPIDLLLQRMGRIFRHEDTLRPPHLQTPYQYILVPEDTEFGVDAYVYPETVLRQSLHIIKGRDHVRIPEDLAPLVASAYDEKQIPPSNIEKWMEHIVGEQVKAGQAKQYLINRPCRTYSFLSSSQYLFDDDENGPVAVQTRLGQPTVRVALLEPDQMEMIRDFLEEREGKMYARIRHKDLARMIQNRSVSLSVKRLKFSENNPYITGDMLISGTRIYPSESDIYQTNAGKIEYDDNLGVVIT